MRKPLDAPAELIPSSEGYARTMVPLRFIAEGLQYQVAWDSENRVAVVTGNSHQWDPNGTTEKQVIQKGLLQIEMYKMFI